MITENDVLYDDYWGNKCYRDGSDVERYAFVPSIMRRATYFTYWLLGYRFERHFVDWTKA